MNDSNFAIRLKLFMDSVGLTSSQLADRCGIPRPSLSSILSGRNKKISDTLIGQIHSVFPQLSVLWLMFGEGDMFLPGFNSSDTVETPTSAIENSQDTSSGITGSDPRLISENSETGVGFVPSQNVNNLKDGSENGSQPILEDLEKGENGASTRMNKGFEGDLRTLALARQIENLKANPRKVTQITIYYDDSTFETFFPAHS